MDISGRQPIAYVQQNQQQSGGESGIVLAANSKITLKMQKSIYRPAIAVISKHTAVKFNEVRRSPQQSKNATS